MKIAFVHDWLVGMAGGEKVLGALCELYDGPIYTLVKDDKALINTIFSSRTIRASVLQKLPKAHNYYRNLLPFFPFAIEQFNLSSYDLILSSSHCVAKSVKTHPNQTHICYCHTPMRYAWDLSSFHLGQISLPKRLIAQPILNRIRHWDKKTTERVDHFIANSACVQARIKQHYGRESTVIHPPVDTHLFAISEEKNDYYLTCSRFVPYKRIDLIIDAFAQMPDKKLVVIGDGPEWKKCKKKATPNIELLGHQSHPVLREKLARARAFVFAAEEDFGIVAVEAQSAGIPVIAYGKGGSLETVLPGQTGLFFKKQTPSSLIDAVHRFEKMEHDFEPEKIRNHALKFSKERFQQEIRAFLNTRS